MALDTVYAPLREWLFAEALPRWSTTGVDRKRGGFFEKIDLTGAATDDSRRTRLVARQIFAFAAAQEMSWSGPAAELVEHGLEFFHTSCVSPDGPVYSVVVPGGAPIKAGFDTYDQAFALFALAAAARAGHDEKRCAAVAHDILEAMRAGWAHPEAGFYECQPPVAPLRANPHMHLFEAALEWLEIRPDDRAWNSLADEIAALALRRFRESATGAVRETYDLEWNAWPDPEHGHVIEPGHQFEWAWLLLRWARLRGHEEAERAGSRLIEIGETHGVDSDGLCVNALDPALSVTDPDRRLWPQTERVKANLIVGNEARASAALQGLSRYFQTAVPGLWVETFRPDGSPVNEPARGSSLYHIICALRETHRHLGG
jgi:mannose-6-phosphate isomerase